MNALPEIPEEELRSAMNFDAVLKKADAYHLLRKRFYRRIKFASFIIAGLFTAGVWFYSSRPAQRKQPELSQIKIKPDTLKTKKKTTEKAVTAAVSVPSQKPVLPAKKTTHPKTASEPVPYNAAEPKDGFPALYDYFSRELKYPSEDVAVKTEGIVTIQFTIEEDGRPGQFKILKSLSPACDKEAARVIEKMPEWKPAVLNGKPVASKVTIPLTFSIQLIRK